MLIKDQPQFVMAQNGTCLRKAGPFVYTRDLTNFKVKVFYCELAEALRVSYTCPYKPLRGMILIETTFDHWYLNNEGRVRKQVMDSLNKKGYSL